MYVFAKGKYRNVKLGKNDKYFYIQDGKRVYTRAKVHQGKKPKKGEEVEYERSQCRSLKKRSCSLDPSCLWAKRKGCRAKKSVRKGKVYMGPVGNVRPKRKQGGSFDEGEWQILEMSSSKMPRSKMSRSRMSKLKRD